MAKLLDRLLAYQVDSADLYFQLSRHESWSLEDGIVKDGAHSIERGVGVRAISGEKTGFAYSDEILLLTPTAPPDMAPSHRRARESTNGLKAWTPNAPQRLYQPIDPLPTLADADKVKLLELVDAEARRQDPRVKQVMVSLAATQDTILVAGSDGTLAADVRPLVRFNVSVIVEQDGRREQGYAGGGGRDFGYGYFQESSWALDLAEGSGTPWALK